MGLPNLLLLPEQKRLLFFVVEYATVAVDLADDLPTA
jgi:hypothetical protein